MNPFVHAIGFWMLRLDMSREICGSHKPLIAKETKVLVTSTDFACWLPVRVLCKLRHLLGHSKQLQGGLIAAQAERYGL